MTARLSAMNILLKSNYTTHSPGLPLLGPAAMLHAVMVSSILIKRCLFTVVIRTLLFNA